MITLHRHTMVTIAAKEYTIKGVVYNGWDSNESLLDAAISIMFDNTLPIIYTNAFGSFSTIYNCKKSDLYNISTTVTYTDIDGLIYRTLLFWEDGILSGTTFDFGTITLTEDHLISETQKLIINGFTGFHQEFSGTGMETPLPNCSIKLYIGGKLKDQTTSDKEGNFTLTVDKALAALPDNSYILATFTGNMDEYPGIEANECILSNDHWGLPDISVSGQLTHNNVRLIF